MEFREIFNDLVAWESLIAVAIFAAFLVGAFILRLIIKTTANHVEKKSPDHIFPQMLKAARGPALLFAIILGLYLSILSLPIEGIEWRQGVTKAWTIGVVLSLVQAAVSGTRFFINWYLKVVAPKTATPLDDKLLPQIRRIILILLYAIGLLIILDTLGVSISPLLGGLGITGLAVALALQPTLGNFFAGTYVTADGAINIGDFIELNGGPAGNVIEVGWRSTKIRTIYNNLVVIPNSVLADTIVTNYQSPNDAMSVIVGCGVSYDSDLTQVESLALETARSVVSSSSHAADFDPIVNFKSFGDSNIDFYVFARAIDRGASFKLTSELIKAIHAEFTKQNIEINYPVRKLIYESLDSLPEIPRVRS